MNTCIGSIGRANLVPLHGPVIKGVDFQFGGLNNIDRLLYAPAYFLFLLLYARLRVGNQDHVRQFTCLLSESWD